MAVGGSRSRLAGAAVETAAVRRTLVIMLAMVPFQAVLSLLMAGGTAASLARTLSFRTSAASGWVAGALVATAYVLASVRSLPDVRSRLLDLRWIKVASIPFSLGAAALEELLFRRMLMNALAHAGLGIVPQVAVSAAAFGAAHSIWGLLSGSWRGVVAPVLWTSVLGGLLALVFVFAERDVAPCVWSHALVNFALEPWLMVALTSRRRSSSAGRIGGAEPV